MNLCIRFGSRLEWSNTDYSLVKRIRKRLIVQALITQGSYIELKGPKGLSSLKREVTTLLGVISRTLAVDKRFALAAIL